MRARVVATVVALCAVQFGLGGTAVLAAPDAPDDPAVATVPVTRPSADASTGFLRVTTSPALRSQISIDGVIANSWGLNWVRVPTGGHRVCFSAVTGYTAPECQSVEVAAGATTTVTGTFVKRGYLHVVTSPAVGAQISVDGIPRNNWGVWTDIPVGSHRICFGAVAGYTPPACQTVDVTAGATTDVTGTFASSPTAPGQTGVGFLRVVSSPAVPTQITVDGNIADTWGLIWMEIAPGSHTVCFSHLEGYTEPGCQTTQVTAGATATVTGTFTPRGYLKVVTSPAVGATITVNGIPSDDWGVYTDLPTGSYRVCFGDYPGKVTPPCQTVSLTGGATTTVTGTYQAHWFCLDHTIKTAADQYAVLNHHDTVWQGGDGAKTVVLPDGRVLWLFGDTITGTVNPDGSLPPTGWKIQRGTGLVQQGACADPLVDPALPTEARPLIPPVSANEFFWPDSGFVDTSTNTLWVIAKDVVVNPATPWGFDIPGQVAAKFSLPDLTYQGRSAMVKPPLSNNPEWALPYSEGGYTYVYTDNGFDHYAARFPTNSTNWAGGSGWQYWTNNPTGQVWSSNAADMDPMVFDQGSIGLVTAVKTPTGYAVVNQFQNKISAWKGPSPVGPWTFLGTVRDFTGTPDACSPSSRSCVAYLGHAATDLPGVDPLIIWSRAQDVNGSTAGSYLGVAAPLIPLG